MTTARPTVENIADASKFFHMPLRCYEQLTAIYSGDTKSVRKRNVIFMCVVLVQSDRGADKIIFSSDVNP
jgi:hypothetical protein